MATTASPGAAPVARSPLVPVLAVAAAGLLLGLLVSRWLLLVVLLAPVLGYVLRWQGQQAAEAAQLRQQQELAAEEERALAERADLLASEHEQLRASAPDPRSLQEAVQSGAGVWAGQGELLVRVGTGDLPSRSVRDAVLTDVPVTVSLSAAGVLGIGGTGARGLARWLVLQAAVQRSPAELSVWLLSDPERTGRDAEWGWLRSLPHNAGSPERCVRLIGATEASLSARVAELQSLVAHRTAMAAEPDGPLGPDVLVVLDAANAVRSLPGVPQLLSTGQSAGVLFVCIAELTGALPAECRVTASLTPEGLELRAGDAPAVDGGAGHPRSRPRRPLGRGPAGGDGNAAGSAPLTDPAAGPAVPRPAHRRRNHRALGPVGAGPDRRRREGSAVARPRVRPGPGGRRVARRDGCRPAHGTRVARPHALTRGAEHRPAQPDRWADRHAPGCRTS